ncbi:MAG: vanadium-dependent haloperoxidase [Burkholderiaceae bacterium]
MRNTKMLAATCAVFAAIGWPTESSVAQTTLADHGANPVSLWSERGAATILQKPNPTGTEQERRPIVFLDMATLHRAIDAAVSQAPAESQAAAAHAAAYTVLKTLYPQRAQHYEEAYSTAMSALHDGPAVARGESLGSAEAGKLLARRAGDGRWADVPPAEPGTAPGAFRGIKPINQTVPRIRPFALATAAQFRGPPPPALDGDQWARDLAETRARGGAASPASEREIEDARFHTEPPPPYWTRNLVRFARSQDSLAANARLMAVLWVTQADATIACFEAKYHYYRWRPATVIAQADKAWKPRLRTPNHPEYPAAHSCATAALAESLALFFGTRELAFAFDSKATGTTHHWASVDDMVTEVREARIVGGMHFRAATDAGEKLGIEVARWVVGRL